jgi:CRP/FNR family cyclic AMP-dependent transcriptional regulator
VRIMKKTLQDEDYTVVILHDHMHIYFGEIALVDNDKRSATVIAETDCELIKLTRKDFLAMAEADPLLGYRIISQIARKISGSLRKMNSDVITLFEALVTEVEGSGLNR